ncbi:hypothetical protein P7K49_032199 [Saguinus oedipus]|uniref:Uncharacterized protein n=1 Tax=Saguinus oedipus TaxID=9490 RepID=A0ABQ9TXK0_SAGOE|nr:hypothetical protein P7K49_032199 [Saguinus oedipus]
MLEFLLVFQPLQSSEVTLYCDDKEGDVEFAAHLEHVFTPPKQPQGEASQQPDHGPSSLDTMNHTVQTFTPASTDRPLNYEMLKEEHEVDVLGAPHNPAPPTSTVIHIRSGTSVPDHVVWSPVQHPFQELLLPGLHSVHLLRDV